MAPQTHFLGLCAILAAACASSESADPGSPAAPLPSGTSTTSPAPSSSTAPAPTGPTPTAATGVLLFATGAPIRGVSFTAGAHTGTTDASGAFTYDEGATVTFTYGTSMVGAARGAAVLSPYQLAGATTCEDTVALKSLVALLEALDTDHDPSNGITAAATPGAAPALGDLDVALHAFIAAFDGEAWKTVATDTFQLFDALVRGQGVASDGTSWFFSGTTGLEKTNDAYASTTKSSVAIPLLLAAQGSDHIGDIDVLGTTIYAPIEDKGYKAPKVVLYDAISLNAGAIYSIPQNLQTGGVPWIAVDGPRGKAYLAEWDPTPAINVFALSTMAYEKSIPLVTTIGRVQGGKVHRGALYLSTDSATKQVYKVHLASGTVIELFALNADVENEGLAFFARSDGSLMHTLDVLSSRTGSELRHHQITREPLRWKVCP